MSKTKLFPALALAASLGALALPASADHGRATYSWRGNPGGAVLYADAGYSGARLELNGAVPDLSKLRFNDRASSVVIRNGAWQVCVDSDFRGRCEIIDASMTRLGAYRLNDNISSLRPVGYGNTGYGGERYDGRRGNRGGWGTGLTLYPDANLQGRGVEIHDNVADLSAWRFNDRASSFQVSGGSWLVCEHANYRGRCEILTAGAGNLKPVRMNDNISSIRRYDGRSY